MNSLNQFSYNQALVLGLAKSGAAAARILLENGKYVRINDQKKEEGNEEALQLKQLGAELVMGGHPLSVLDDIELVVKNPGIPYDNAVVEEAVKRGIPVITEIELAGLLAKGPIVGITGSNGKTTTTTLIYEMLRNSGKAAKLSGNIGTVASEVAKESTNDDVLVVELSSFQLLGIETFRPNISVLLNIFEAHLDYHKTLDHYANAKANIFKNQTLDDYLVYNLDDELVVQLVEKANVKKIPFSVNQRCEYGVWSDGETVFFQNEPIVKKREIVLVGTHNFENILAAIGAARAMGAKPEAIRHVLQTFQGVRHRLQFVRQLNERLFYNDSKATNILATSKALTSFNQPIILLAGGLDRGNGFSELIPNLKNVKAIVTFGETADKLKQTAKQAGINQIDVVDNVEQAVQIAYANSHEGDVILLSPACASWDQYRSFEERGDMFVQAVHKL